MTINFLSRNQFVVLGQMDVAIKFQCAATMVILMLMKNLLFMEFAHGDEIFMPHILLLVAHII